MGIHVDAATQQTLWNAVIGLIVAVSAYLNWKRTQGMEKTVNATKVTAESTNAKVTTHNETVKNDVLPKLDSIQTNTNGKLADMQKQVVDLTADKAALQAEIDGMRKQRGNSL